MRLARLAMALATLAFAGRAAALDTPLILTPSGVQVVNSELLLSIAPGQGVITYYHATQQMLERAAGAAFLFQMSMIENSYAPRSMATPGNVPWNMLRLGGPLGRVQPTALEFIAMQDPKPVLPGLPSLQQMSITAEDEFWSKPHPYDGIVRAAWDLDYALLAVPSTHTLLLYHTSDQVIELIGWMNYGPLLLTAQGLNTNPTPQVLFAQMPAPIQTKILHDQQKRLKQLLRTKSTPQSDVWVGAAMNNTFIVADTRNQVIFTVQWNGRAMVIGGIRNIAVDLSLPSGWDWNSQPPGGALLADYRQKNAARIAKYGLAWLFPAPNDDFLVRAFVKTRTKSAPSQELQANCLNDKVVFDFTQQTKLLTYNLAGQSLDLISDREYGLDMAVMQLEQELERRQAAQEALQTAHDFLPKSPNVAMSQLQYALALDPFLLDKVTKDTRITSHLKNNADYEATLDKAEKDQEAAKKEHEAIVAEADKQRQAYNDLKSGKLPPDDSDDAGDSPAPAGTAGSGTGGGTGSGGQR